MSSLAGAAMVHDSPRRRRARAIGAATVVARSHGVDVHDPLVLADSNNTIVHLRPAPVVAKVGTTWIRHGPTALAQELAVAVHVARRGGPIPAPATEVPIQVHLHDGLAMTFWRLIKPSGAGPPATVTAASLRRLHGALSDYSGSLRSFREELDELVLALGDPTATPTLEASDRAFLRRTLHSALARLTDDEDRTYVLHGDPHEGNCIAVEGDVVWVDLEAVSRGPLEWDLSALDDEDADLFGEADPQLLAMMRDLRSCRVAALCWMQPGRAPAVDEAAVWHLAHLRTTHGQRAHRT